MSGIDQSQKLKTIKTDDLNVDQPKETLRDHAIPGQIKRDTAANIAGGKQVRTCRSLASHFGSTSDPLPVHFRFSWTL